MSRWYNILKKEFSELKFKDIDDKTVRIQDRVILHRDLFERRPKQVSLRLSSLFGYNHLSEFARNTKVVELEKEEAQHFIEEHHLMGFGGGSVFLGLRDEVELVAVAVFSKIRFMKYENPPYNSVELERYCSLSGTNVVGGMDKLIRAYLKEYSVQDMITYVDLEWSTGESYLKLGFQEIDRTPALQFKIDKNWNRILIRNEEDGVLSKGDYIVENKGNVKLRKVV